MERLVSPRQEVSWPICVGAEVVPHDEAQVVPSFQIAESAYRSWWSIRRGHVPYKQELDPIEFGPKLLPCLSLVDVIQDGADYFWRLAGEKANDAMGVSLRGRFLSEIEALQPDQVLYRTLLDQVIRSCDPLFYVIRYSTVSGCRKRAYGVLLPLMTKDGESASEQLPVQCILGACHTAQVW